MLLKLCTQYASKFGKLGSAHRTGKGQFSLQSQRKAMAKKCSNYRTIALISHTSKVMLKILQARLQQYMNWELPDVQAGFRKGRGTRSNRLYPLDYRKSKRIPGKKKHLFLLHWLCQSLWLCESQWEILQEVELPDPFTCLLRNLYAGQEATESEMKQHTGWKLGKEYIRLCIVTLFI